MNIYVSNHSTVLTDAAVAAHVPAFQTYCGHVAAYWPRPMTLKFVTPPEVPANQWEIRILDDSDQQGALGYHDYQPGGKPISYVFARTDKQYGYNWTVTLTHELAEMAADPWISELFQVTNTKLYAKEIGDPVEADQYGYVIAHTGQPDTVVSDFVTPAWFIPGHPGPVFDRAKHCTHPLQILSGGYMSIYVSCQGWTQVNAQHEQVAIDPNDPRFRDRG